MTIELVATLALGVGLYLLLTALPVGARRPSLDARLRQFDADARVAERRTPKWAVRPLLPWAGVDAVVRPLLEDLAGPLRRVLGAEGAFGAELERQLRLLRPGTDPRLFVAQQLLVGGGVALAVLVFFLAIGQLPALGLLMSVLGGLAGFLAPQVRLRARARQRRERIVTELPALCRLLTLALDAGMSLDRALLAVARRSAGPLGRALLAAQKEVVGDRRLKDALADLAGREQVSELEAFIGLLCVSDQEGLELIPSLEAMATSLNEKRAARTIEAAEKGSIKMLAPVAFVMFPVALAIALAPLVGTVLSLLGHSS
jgi:tight adherence protein C